MGRVRTRRPKPQTQRDNVGVGSAARTRSGQQARDPSVQEERLLPPARNAAPGPAHLPPHTRRASGFLNAPTHGRNNVAPGRTHQRRERSKFQARNVSVNPDRCISVLEIPEGKKNPRESVPSVGARAPGNRSVWADGRLVIPQPRPP